MINQPNFRGLCHYRTFQLWSGMNFFRSFIFAAITKRLANNIDKQNRISVMSSRPVSSADLIKQQKMIKKLVTANFFFIVVNLFKVIYDVMIQGRNENSCDDLKYSLPFLNTVLYYSTRSISCYLHLGLCIYLFYSKPEVVIEFKDQQERLIYEVNQKDGILDSSVEGTSSYVGSQS